MRNPIYDRFKYRKHVKHFKDVDRICVGQGTLLGTQEGNPGAAQDYPGIGYGITLRKWRDAGVWANTTVPRSFIPVELPSAPEL